MDSHTFQIQYYTFTTFRVPVLALFYFVFVLFCFVVVVIVVRFRIRVAFLKLAFELDRVALLELVLELHLKGKMKIGHPNAVHSNLFGIWSIMLPSALTCML